MRTKTTLLFSFFSLFLSTYSFSQLNMTLQDSMDYNVGVNDVCGWAAPDGKEYALVGINTGVSIVDINEDTLKQVVFVPGQDNLWRDINTYSHYAYVSSEAHIGLLIIDLQFLPDSVHTWVWKDSLPTPNGPRPFEKAHSLWTDEDGFLFLNGSNLNSGGVIICDIKNNPTDPTFLGYAPAIYAHDSYSRDSILYTADIYAGNATIYDIHDPANIIQLGQVKTPYEFTHNTWLSDNSQVMFTTDERANSYVTSYDISNPSNIIELDRYRQAATDGLGNIVHNVYIWNDWAVVAYYANGTVILDAAHPDNLVEVGNFDSFLGADGGFPGVWGSYPFLPSGKILSSDRNNGLFVFIPNYVRAAYLEGSVVDASTHLPIDNAVVTIQSDEIIFPQSTKPDGTFKMGKAVPGQYNVVVKKTGYYTKTTSFNFVNGQLLNPTIELIPIPVHSFSGNVIYENQAPVPNAYITLSGPDAVYETIADVNGQFLFPAVYEGTYNFDAGIWGFTSDELIDVSQPTTMTATVKKGYRDDFDLDLGWTISGDAISGQWTRELPFEQWLYLNVYQCGSQGDSPNDRGPYAFTTGPSVGIPDVQDSEVNGGTTWLSSPPMDFRNLVEPKINFDYWLCEFPPNQYNGLFAWITNGADTLLLDQFHNDTTTGSWQSKTYDHLSLEEPLDSIRFLISATDTTTGTNFYYLKAHFDHFEVTESPSAVGDEFSNTATLLLYPNPYSGTKLYLKSNLPLTGERLNLQFVNSQGQIVRVFDITKDDFEKGIHVELLSGLYVVKWKTERGEQGVEKLIVSDQK